MALSVKNYELDDAKREKLEKFRDKARHGRIVREWRTAVELAIEVTATLAHNIHDAREKVEKKARAKEAREEKAAAKKRADEEAAARKRADEEKAAVAVWSIRTYDSGSKYEGYLLGGQRHGTSCKMTYANGDTYFGDWVDDKMTGKGTFTWKNGDKYEGDWVDGKRTGKGTFTWKDGDKYEGDWVDSKRTGKGIYIWPDGNKYEGDFVDINRHGKGIFTYSDGSKLIGNFFDGNFVK